MVRVFEKTGGALMRTKPHCNTAILAASALLLSVVSALAGDEPPNIWNKICFNVPTGPGIAATFGPPETEPKTGNLTKVCLTQADVRDNATAVLIGRVAVRQVASQDKVQLLAMLPLNSALRSGATIRIGDRQPIELQYAYCDQAGCYADATVDAAVVEQMKTAGQVSYSREDIAGRSVSIPLPLKGFARIFDGAPLPLSKYNEDQNRIADIIKHIADARKKQGDVKDSKR